MLPNNIHISIIQLPKDKNSGGIMLEQFHLPSVTISNNTTPYAHLDDENPINNKV